MGHTGRLRDHWNHIKKSEREELFKNAYRVLLTRARQGMIMLYLPVILRINTTSRFL